jgi:hypothetical protein
MQCECAYEGYQMNYCNVIKSQQNLLKNSLILTVLGTMHTSVHAALPADAILTFDPGQIVCLVGGTPPNCDSFLQDVAGSYFAMDFNGDDVFEGSEKTPIENNEGVRIGDVQPALGSHPGFPDGTELPSIDVPWVFFANTGMHQTTLPVVIVNGDDGTGDNIASVSFSGWGVTWNGIPNIPLGGDSANFPADTGVAVITCSSECNAGDTFSLEYTAHVPLGDPSGFGGVYYSTHLEGVIDPGSPIPPTKSVSIQLTGGNSQECALYGGSIVEATADIITTDPNDIVAVSWDLDGVNAGSGNSIDIFTSLGDHTISVFVDTLVSGSFQSTTPVTVSDSTPPELGIRFIDQRTGVEITEVTGNGANFVTVRYDVVDICDPEPTASGVAVPVHAIDDGDTIIIKKKKLATTALGTSAVNVSADAIDASGNQRHREATLLIVD